MHIFMKKLNESLIEDDYQVIPTDVDYVHMFGKVKQNYLYLLNIIVLEEGTMISLDQYKVYKQITKNQFQALGFEQTYLLNLYLTCDAKKDMGQWEEITPDFEENFTDFHWFVDIEREKLAVPKNQPKKFLNVNDLIHAIFQNTTYHTKPKLELKTKRSMITYGLVILNTVIWLWMEGFGSSYDPMTLVDFGALYSPFIQQYKEYYRLITAVFLHIGFSHLLYNMAALYIFGSRVEKVLGRVNFLLLYLLAGLGGSLLSYGVAIATGVPKLAAGASGAIYGLQGAALYTAMHRRGNLEGLSEGWLWAATFGGLIFGFLSANVDNMAHVGGLFTGYALMYLFLKPAKNE